MVAPIFATWDDYGCKPSDPAFDNGPKLSAMLAKMVRGEIPLPPVGRMAPYYIKSTIDWPTGLGGALEGSGGNRYAHDLGKCGVTSIVYVGEPDKPMVNYCAHGGRMGRMVLCGGMLSNQYPITASHGIYVPSIAEPGSGGLVTDQLAIVQCDTGIECNSKPDDNHSDLMKHQFLLMHRVNDAYVTDAEQSTPHWFNGFDLRGIFKRAFVFKKGGGLNVTGMYVGGGTPDQTLLHIGKANDYVGNFDIHGLQVDGTVKGLTLVNHGQFAMKVRIDGGNIRKADQLACPMVVERDGFTKYADIDIDLGAKCQYRRFHSE